MSRKNGREQRILDAAASLFAERAPESVTMDEVARRAGVAKGTLYLYFPSKHDMVRTLLERRHASLTTGLQRAEGGRGDAWCRLRAGVELAFRAQVDAPDWFRLRRRTDDAGSDQGDHELRAAFDRLLSGLPRRSGTRSDADLVLGAVDAAVCRSLASDPPDRCAEERALWRFVRRALGGRALAGRTVLVTREESADGTLGEALRAHDAEPVHVPLLETRPPRDPTALREQAGNLASFDWVLLTSARAVRALAEAAHGNGGRPHIAAVGEATAREARSRGWSPRVVGRSGAADLMHEMCGAGDLAGKRVLFPAADRALGESVQPLREAGADVRVVTAYRTTVREGARAQLGRALGEATPDAVTFTSPSAVCAFGELAGTAAIAGVRLAGVIGPTTADAARSAGFERIVTAARPDMKELAQAIASALDDEEEWA